MTTTNGPTDDSGSRPADDPRHEGQDSLDPLEPDADSTRMSVIDTTMHQLIDHLVDQVPGVWGALVSSVDGLVLASRVTHTTSLDAAAIAAMSAAVLGLSNRLVQLMGAAPASFSHQRSADGQVFVFGVSKVAVLTVLADPNAESARIQSVGHEVGIGLERLFHGTSNV